MDLYMLNHQLESKPESNINIIDRSYISQRDNKGSKISKTNKNSARSTK